MFKTETDQRLQLWFEFRKNLEGSQDPFQDVVDFWDQAPRIPHNHLIDPYYDREWPTPWEIIERNKYDDFTKALMIGYSLKWTTRFENTPIEIRTFVDSERNMSYNIVCVDNKWAINYTDLGPIELESWPDQFLVQNLVELKVPR